MTAYFRPRDLSEALALRAREPAATVLAGGTDLMVGATHRPAPAGFLDLFGLRELTRIDVEDAAIRIGAGVTYAAMLRSETVRREVPLLCAAAREIGAVQIQSRATMAGNVATSSPVGDTLPVLLALDASVELASVRGARSVPYSEFCTGYRKTAIAADELIVAFSIPRAPSRRWVWRKVGTRRAQAISKLMVAMTADVGASKALANVRVAAGAVADRPIRLGAVERAVEGRSWGPELASEVRAHLEATVTPITDVRSTAEYRRDVLVRLVQRGLEAMAS